MAQETRVAQSLAPAARDALNGVCKFVNERQTVESFLTKVGAVHYLLFR